MSVYAYLGDIWEPRGIRSRVYKAVSRPLQQITEYRRCANHTMTNSPFWLPIFSSSTILAHTQCPPIFFNSASRTRPPSTKRTFLADDPKLPSLLHLKCPSEFVRHRFRLIELNLREPSVLPHNAIRSKSRSSVICDAEPEKLPAYFGGAWCFEGGGEP